MAARKRTPFQREEDLVQITRLYLQGRTQRDIAEVVGVTSGRSQEVTEAQSESTGCNCRKLDRLTGNLQGNE
jgi:hypothetical protein